MKALKLNSIRNIAVLAVLWLTTTGAGLYVTFVQQPKELESVKQAEELARLKQSEVGSLLAQVATSEQQANDAMARWNARYKELPDSLNSPEVVGYLNNLTRIGFKNFDVTLEGIERKPDYNYFTFAATGRAYYASLYRFIWDIENSRKMYRVRDLQVDHTDVLTKDKKALAERMEIMVSFSMKIDAYYGGLKGLSADSVASHVKLASVSSSAPPKVPANILPAYHPATNPFFPVVLSQLPPNTYGLVDVETAVLAGIVNGKAVFKDDRGYRKLGIGESVYLGHIVSIDPTKGVVVVRLNKGGIADEIELSLNAGDPFEQAKGSSRLSPALN